MVRIEELDGDSAPNLMMMAQGYRTFLCSYTENGDSGAFFAWVKQSGIIWLGISDYTYNRILTASTPEGVLATLVRRRFGPVVPYRSLVDPPWISRTERTDHDPE